jgi:hypothetical protein
MATKVKISRSFTFKAYKVKNSEEVLKNAHKGEFMLKSECHYYCEKGVLDFVKLNAKESEKYLIYKISTLEDSNIEDMLIEQIFIKDGIINII